MNGRQREEWARALISAVILTVLCLQALAAFLAPNAFYQRAWPFLSYSMYSFMHGKSELAQHQALIGVTRDGKEVPIGPRDLGLDFSSFRAGPLTAALLKDARLLRKLLKRHRDGGAFVSARVVLHRGFVNEKGVIRIPPSIEAAVDLASEDPGP